MNATARPVPPEREFAWAGAFAYLLDEYDRAYVTHAARMAEYAARSAVVADRCRDEDRVCLRVAESV
jgi:hypothetical protein